MYIEFGSCAKAKEKARRSAAGLVRINGGLDRHHRCRRAASAGLPRHQRQARAAADSGRAAAIEAIRGLIGLSIPIRVRGVNRKVRTPRRLVRCRAMARDQLSFLAPADRPEGLAYAADFLGEAEEAALAGRMDALDFRPFEFHGFLGKRQTVSFGWSYRFDGSGLGEAPPIPLWLHPVRARAAAFAGLAADQLEHALLIKYEAGAGLGWHRDRPVFGDVIGISLLSPAPLRFRRRDGTKWRRFTLAAAPRSIYLLRGPSRTEWEHSLVPVAELRYSITFRTLAARAQL
jgi:alkylated DNA repair dioxygenase AlkB